MGFRKTLSSTRSKFTHPLLKLKNQNLHEESNQEDSFSSIRNVRASEADIPSTSVPKGKGRHQAIIAAKQSKTIEKVMKDEEMIVPVKRKRLTGTAEKSTPSIYESLRSRNNGNSTLGINYSHQRGSPSGLANMGNTCYMNSVLQATFINDSFSKSLFESLIFFKKEALNSESFIRRYLPLMEALSNLLSNRCSGISLTVFLRSVLGCVSTAADKFRNNRQEDAHEFLTDMLSQLQSEYNEAVRQLNGRRPHFLKTNDPIRECFGYTLRRIFSCQNCQNETSVEEENTNFIVHISNERLKSGKFTFADILRDSMAEEIVEHVCDKYIPNQSNHENRVKAAANMECSSSTSKVRKQPKNNLPRGIDTRWRDRKINSSKIGYLVEDADEEETLHNAFDNLLKWCQENVGVKAKVTRCTTVSDEQDENANNLLYALSGGNEALYVKLREKIWDLLSSNADLYANMLGKSEKAFRDFIKNKARKCDMPPTNLELHGCAALF
uniref:USP domain-containing protein n=1 Tax=Panagrolaimus sp. PS1159 TaxID=55785 RepID=A0AC35GLN4_9BILA